VPRAGLDPERVTREALRFVDEAGMGALSVASLAARLGVQRPSLYNHLRSMEGLRDSLRSLVHAEVAEMAEKVTPRGGREGLLALLLALRRYVVRHPRRIDLLLENVEDATGPLREGTQRLLGRVMELLGSLGLTGASAVHAARLLRAIWIGFALIESRGGYAMDVPVEASFTFALDAMYRALAPKRKGARPSRP
jgi:AcrR family transcriptional regulator